MPFSRQNHRRTNVISSYLLIITNAAALLLYRISLLSLLSTISSLLTSSLSSIKISDYPRLPCHSGCTVRVKNSMGILENDSSLQQETFVNKKCSTNFDTPSCVDHMYKLLNSTNLLDSDYDNATMDQCDPRALNVNITPYYSTSSDFEPLMKLNVSVAVHDKRTKAFVLRQVCVEPKLIGQTGRPKVDLLCAHRVRPAHWGRFHWSCRMFDWSDLIDRYGAENFSYPIKNHYDCFHMGTVFDVLSIHVILYPQNCRNSYTYTAIHMHNYRQATPDGRYNWLPFVYVDTNRLDGLVAVNFNLPTPDYGIGKIVLEIYKMGDDDSLLCDLKRTTNQKSTNQQQRLIKSRDVDVAGSNGSTLFTGLKCGSYKIVAYPYSEKCAHGKCLLSVYVPFTLNRDYYARWADNDDDHVTPWLTLFWTLVVLTALICILGVALTVYSRHKARMRRRHPVMLNFSSRPKVFFVYTDDTVHHRLCVMYLAEYLSEHVNCEVLLDEWVLRNPILSHTTNECEWAIKCAASCDYFLIVFSEGSKVSFDQRAYELKPERPWMELYGLSMTCVLQDILQQTRVDPSTKLPKIICVTFNYSDSVSVFNNNYLSPAPNNDHDIIPQHFRYLPCPKFVVPDQLADLIFHLHKIPPAACITDDGPLGGTRLLDQIERTKNFYATNPDWLTERLAPLEEHQRLNQSDIERTLAALNNGAYSESDGRLRSETLHDLYTRLQEQIDNEGGRFSLVAPEPEDDSLNLTNQRQFTLMPYKDEEDDDENDDDPVIRNDDFDIPLMVFEPQSYEKRL